MSEHLYTYDDPPSERHLEKAVKILENDGVIVMPTATNWAFCCDPRRSRAIDRIHRLKPMHDDKRPFSFIVSSISMAAEVGNIDNYVYPVLKKVWPGPFTIIVKRNRVLPRHLKDKRQTVGIRNPDCNLCLALVERLGFPLLVTSVPHRADGFPYHMGYEIFDVYGHGIDLLFDLGEEVSGEESTIIDFSEGGMTVLREGAGDLRLLGLSS
jgi:tRNA threonylcarbamoyl adenosine modification protein (Sua5/YciO/YrdC/YwlC family)